MATHTRVSGKTASNTDKALPNGRAVRLIKGNTRIGREMGTEFKHGQTEINMKESTRMIKMK